jgi:hypothetical protein
MENSKPPLIKFNETGEPSHLVVWNKGQESVYVVTRALREDIERLFTQVKDK